MLDELFEIQNETLKRSLPKYKRPLFYDIELGSNGQIPLWYFGFLY